MTQQVYIIALKREHRASVPFDWLAWLGTVPGLRVLGGGGQARAQVAASEGAIQAVRERLGEYAHIEEEIRHEIQGRIRESA